MIYKFILGCFVCISLSLFGNPSDDHSDKNEHGEHKEKENGHKDEDNEAKEFVLSEEGKKNFNLAYVEVVVDGRAAIPLSAFVTIKDEKFIYRLRSNKFLRISFSRNKEGNSIFSESLKKGDRVVTSGVNFLRIAELTINSTESNSHQH